MSRTVDNRDEKMSIVSDLHVKGKELISNSSKGAEGVAINVRIPRGIVNGIDDWVEDEMFRSRSDFLLSAARHYLLYLADKKLRSSEDRGEMID